MTPTTSAIQPTRPLIRVGGLPRVVAKGPLGGVGELLRDQFEALRRWQRDYGGVFELRFGPMSFVIVGDVNSATEMLIEGGQRFVRGGSLYDPVKPLLGASSMLTAEGEIWRERRRSAQPMFRQRAVAAMAPRIDHTLLGILDELQPGERDMYRFSGRISMSVALAIMFSHGLTAPGFEPLADALDFAIDRIAAGWISQRLPRWLPLPGRRRYVRSLAYIDEVIARFAGDRLATGDYGDDLLGMLLHLADRGELAPEALRDEAVTLIVAGYETTANAIGWALWELARRPDIRARVQAEADAVLRDGPPQNPHALAYTRQVFSETLRMYPSTIWLPRNAAEDTTIAGYPLRAGAAVLCSPYLVHHDPHAWDDPERFDPERFAEGSNQPRNRHAYMPFGLGQHMCAGQHLAMLEGPLVLARLVQRWEIEPIPGREPSTRISTTMNAKDGIWLKLTPRS